MSLTGMPLSSGGAASSVTSLAGYLATAETSGVVAGGNSYDGSSASSVTFSAVLASTDGILASHAQLWNLTDSVAVTGCDLTTTSAASTLLTAAIVPGTTAGFPASVKVYEVRVWVASGTGAEFAVLHSAGLE